MEICGICGKRFKKYISGKTKKSTTNFTNLRKSKSVEICGICVKRFKSTLAVKQKNQPQIYANLRKSKSAESAVKDLKVH